MSKESSPDIIDVEIPEPANQTSPTFWGPLIHVFNLIDLSVKIHILIAALLFPQFAGGNNLQQPSPSPLLSYRIWSLSLGCIILLLNALAIFVMVNFLARGELIQFAKALFIVIAWKFSIFALIVVNHGKSINTLLFAVEDEATHSRDESVMLIRAGQAGLRSLNRKVYGEEAPSQMLTASELIKSIGPLALLFLNKERNILRWGMVGASVATKGIRFVQILLQQK